MIKGAFRATVEYGVGKVASAACRWRYAGYKDAVDNLTAAAGIAMRYYTGKSTAEIIWTLARRGRITVPPYIVVPRGVQNRVEEIERVIPNMKAYYTQARQNLPNDMVLTPPAVTAFFLNSVICAGSARFKDAEGSEVRVAQAGRAAVLEKIGVLLRSYALELEPHKGNHDENPLDLAVAYGVHLQKTTPPEKLMVRPETRATYFALKKAGAVSLLAAFEVGLGVSDIAFLPQVPEGGAAKTSVRAPR